MNDDNPLANNWVRAAVDTIAERTLAEGNELPTAALEEFLADTRHSPRSRRLAFEWIVKANSDLRDRWVPELLNDPSLELRREAVGQQIEKGNRGSTPETGGREGHRERKLRKRARIQHQEKEPRLSSERYGWNHGKKGAQV